MARLQSHPTPWFTDNMSCAWFIVRYSSRKDIAYMRIYTKNKLRKIAFIFCAVYFYK